MRAFQIPEQVLQATIGYLQTKPFNEVNQLLQAIGTTARMVEVPDAAQGTGVTDVNKDGA